MIGMYRFVWQTDTCEVRRDEGTDFWFCQGCLADWRIPGDYHEADGTFKISQYPTGESNPEPSGLEPDASASWASGA